MHSGRSHQITPWSAARPTQDCASDAVRNSVDCADSKHSSTSSISDNNKRTTFTMKLSGEFFFKLYLQFHSPVLYTMIQA